MSMQVEFDVDETFKRVAIDIIDDDEYDPEEVFQVRIDGEVDGQICPDNVAFVTILDDECKCQDI